MGSELVNKGNSRTRNRVINKESVREKIKFVMRTLEKRDYSNLSDCEWLANKFKEHDYDISKSNIKMYITDERSLGIDFMYVFSKVFQVSLDYFIDDTIKVDEIGDYQRGKPHFNITDDEYAELKEYFSKSNTYFFYFLPTNHNELDKGPVAATLIISGFHADGVSLTIPESGTRAKKEFAGSLNYDKKLRKVYGRFHEKAGNSDVLQFIFNTESENVNVGIFDFAMGYFVSATMGRSTRYPVTQRFFLSRRALNEAGLQFLNPHFYMNNSYVHIEKRDLADLILDLYAFRKASDQHPNNMMKIISELFEENEEIVKVRKNIENIYSNSSGEDIDAHVKDALNTFCPDFINIFNELSQKSTTILTLDEDVFFTTSFKKDHISIFKTPNELEFFISRLRNISIGSIRQDNNKVRYDWDLRMFSFLKNTNCFEDA